MNRLLLISALAATVAVSHAQAASVEAFDNATIQPNGPRTGSSGLAFFNIEGSGNGSFASYGVARFDLSAMKDGFDSNYGVGGWKLDSIDLQLTQSNAGFTTDGGVDVYYTKNDSTDPLQGSGLQFGNFAADFSDAAKIVSYTFTEASTGSLESHVLYAAAASNSIGGMNLAADILGDNIVTLALVEGSSSVAATYAGYTNFSYQGPTLAVNVSAVPEPETYVMLLAGLGLLAARRKPLRQA